MQLAARLTNLIFLEIIVPILGYLPFPRQTTARSTGFCSEMIIRILRAQDRAQLQTSRGARQQLIRSRLSETIPETDELIPRYTETTPEAPQTLTWFSRLLTEPILR